MLRLSALMISTYCIAFIVTSVVAAPERLRASMAVVERVIVGLFEAEASERTEEPVARRAIARADALVGAGASPPRPRTNAAFAEIGIDPSGVIAAHDDAGRLVFAHDPSSRTTVVARGVVPPRLSMGPASPDPRLDVVPNPVAPETRPDAPPRGQTVPLGCESAVGPLASSDEPPRPVLCLARL